MRDEHVGIAGHGVETPVAGLWREPAGAWCVLALAHGAGAGMRHPFMEALAAGLAGAGVATLRYEFPYMTAGRKRPDPPAALTAAVRAAAAEAVARAGARPVFAGGKSMGGRMTSTASAETPLPGVAGLVFYGFPLHPAKAPARTRGQHLFAVESPMLFLQGTRDALAEMPLMREVHGELAAVNPRAELHVVEGADHGFAVLKSSGRTDAQVLAELVAASRRFFEEAAAR